MKVMVVVEVEVEVGEDMDLETGRWRRTSSEQLRGLSVSRISITVFMATGLLMILSLCLFVSVISNKCAGVLAAGSYLYCYS